MRHTVCLICGGLPSMGSDFIDPLVEVEVAMWPVHRAQQKTASRSANGLDLNWNTAFEFGLQGPELDFVLMYLWIGDPMDGEFVPCVRALGMGVRAVRLRGSVSQESRAHSCCVC
jgi:hypothetical protein